MIHKLLAAWSGVLFCAGYLCVLLYGRTSSFRVCVACWCELINCTKMHCKYNVKLHLFIGDQLFVYVEYSYQCKERPCLYSPL
jgi:hypothetical protein